MKTKILGIALAVALLLSPMAFIALARAQARDVYASEVELTFGTDTMADDVEYKLPALINMEEGGSFTYNGTTYTIKPNDGAVYDADGKVVGKVTQTKYYTEPSETPELVVTIAAFSHNAYDGDPTEWYYYSQAKIGEEKKDLPSPIIDKGEGLSDGSFTIDDKTYKYDKDGKVYLDGMEVGNLVKAYAVHPGDDIYVQVTLKATDEPVGGATVSWPRAIESETTTDPWGVAAFTVKDVTYFDDRRYGVFEPVEAVKEYGTNETVKRSAYGASENRIAVIEFDTSIAAEFLVWLEHIALTEEAQAMYEAAEILGEWGANLGGDVTVWSNIFGPKGGSLAEFIRGFPNFMVDRGAAIEATKNMLDTLWALFGLLPAFALALPELLRTAPMRMLQFWPVLFTNLDKVLKGISQMVIDLGLFMMSLAPSVLMLLPEMFEKLPEVGPEAMNIVLTAFEFFVQMIPALSQYIPAAIAAIPAFFIQMLTALFFNAVAIFETAMDEFVSTFEKLLRSWPLFFAGIAAGILAVAPALMMLPSLAPLRLVGRTLVNTCGACGAWGQSLREMPSTMLDPILHACGTNPITLIGRYGVVGLYCVGTSIMFLPEILLALFFLALSLTPLELLGCALTCVPLLAVWSVIPCLGLPVRLIVGPLWACWMGASVLAAFVANVASGLADALEVVVTYAMQVCTLPGYAVGWCLQGVLDIVKIGFVEDLTKMLEDIIAKFPEIIDYIQPIIEAIIKQIIPMVIQGASALPSAATSGSSGLLDLLSTLGPFLAGALAGGAGGATVGAAGGAVATGAAAAVSPIP